MEIKELKLKIIDLIAKDELDKALEMLKENMSMDNPAYVTLIMQMRRLNNLQNKTINATIAFNEANMERNKISQSLIQMTQALSEHPPTPSDNTNPTNSFQTPPEPPRFENPPIHNNPPKYEDPLLDDFEDDYEDDFEDAPSSGILGGYQREIFYDGSPSMEYKTLTVNQSYDFTFLKCVQAISYNGFTLNQQDQKMGYIQATTGISIWSFGEQIHIYIRELEEGKGTFVHIICDSVMKTTVTSWGKNAKNIDKIITVLTQM